MSEANSLDKEYNRLSEQIGAEVHAYFAAEAAHNHGKYGEIGDVTDRLVAEFAARPAKHLRGILAIVGYRMFGGDDREVELGLARGFEAKQDELLFMDDVADNSAMRRGGPTLHLQFRDHFETRLEAAQQAGLDIPAVDTTKLGSDFAYNTAAITSEKADLELLKLKVDPARLIAAMTLLKENMIVTGYGQGEDLYGSQFGVEDKEEQDIIQMYIHKTAHYTVINPLLFGACLAGAEADDLEALREFGTHAGLAFQLRDDYLGMYGDEAKTGKSVLNDLKERKVTLLILHVLKTASESDKQTVRKALGNRALDEEEYRELHQEVLQIMHKNGTERFMEEATHEAAENAHQVLRRHPEWLKTEQGSMAVDFLHRLMIKFVRRES